MATIPGAIAADESHSMEANSHTVCVSGGLFTGYRQFLTR